MRKVLVDIVAVERRWFRKPLVAVMIGRQEEENGPIVVKQFIIELGQVLEVD